MSQTRQRLIDAAAELFLRDGIHATGIAAVAERASVSKMTLYAHFGSKDALVVDYLDQRDAAWNASVDAALASLAGPAERLLGLFDSYRDWLRRGDFRGCAYVNCAAEFPDREHPVRLAVARHKRGVQDRLAALAKAAGLRDAEVLARRLFLLLEGAFLTGALEQDGDTVGEARRLAEELIDRARS